MGKSISSDLRDRIVRGIEAGQSRRSVAVQFEVSAATAVRVQARYVATSSVEPSKQGRPKGTGKLATCRQAIVGLVRIKPDVTMPDLAMWLEAQHGVTVDPSSLSKFLRRDGFTYKKNASGIGERTQRRESSTP